MTARRCLLHAEPLRRGVRARVPATVLAGRKHAFLAAERTQFPGAAAFLFCRTGSLNAEFCAACRAALGAWLASGAEAQQDWRTALAVALARAERIAAQR